MSKSIEFPASDASERFFSSIHEQQPTTAETANRMREGLTSHSEESLQLVQRVFFAQTEESPRAVVFAGVEDGNGCSDISAAVAETLARITTGTVCLLDANFRTPSLSSFFGSTERGFFESLYRKESIRSYAKQVDSSNLWFIPSGTLTPDAAGALGLESLRTRIAELRSEFDYLIIDVAPLARYADAMSLARWSDGLVMVLEANSTRRELASVAAQNLRAAHIDILAAVLNNATSSLPAGLERRL